MLDIIGVTYNHGRKLDIFLASLLEQTSKDFKVSIYHDGPWSEKTRDQTFRWTAEFMDEGISSSFIQTETRANDYGHSLRDLGIQATTAEYINLQNCDNYLTPRFVELMLDKAKEESLDFVYCDILHSYANTGDGGKGPYNVLYSRPCLNYIDIANFIVCSDAARKEGFKHRVSHADGLFVNELVVSGLVKVGKVESCLLVHN